MKTSILLILGFSLVACAPAKSTAEAPPAASSQESASELAPKAVLLPAGFAGHWDASIEACKTTSDMKLVITQTEMTFWESTGQITAVTINTPEDVTVKAALSGEGEQWQRELHLVINPGGSKLMVDDIARVRCQD